MSKTITIGGTHWKRVTAENCCPICGKPDWCLISQDGSKALCQRKQSVERWGNAGWLHNLKSSDGSATDTESSYTPSEQSSTSKTTLTDSEIHEYLSETQVNMSPKRRKFFSEAFQFDLSVIDEMHVGVDLLRGAWVFPMFGRDRDASPTGFRLRAINTNRKWALRGSKAGLFYAGPAGEEDLWVVEGPTDCAALACLGLWSIGLPSINSGHQIVRAHVVDMARKGLAPRRIVWVVEGDEAGRCYEQLAVKFLAKCGVPTVSVWLPPQYKDIRDWYCDGVSKEVLMSIADQQEEHYV